MERLAEDSGLRWITTEDDIVGSAANRFATALEPSAPRPEYAVRTRLIELFLRMSHRLAYPPQPVSMAIDGFIMSTFSL